MTSITTRIRMIIGICLLATAPLQGADDLDTIEIRILPESVIYGEYYTLGEIAELDGFDVETIQKLAQVEIGKSPLPGHSYLVSRGQVENRIRSFGKDLNLKLMHPSRAMVSRAALKIKADDIKQIILEEVKKHYAEYNDIDITIRTHLRDVYIPKGKASYEIKRLGGKVQIGGYSSWMLSLKLNGQEVKKLLIRLKVQVYDEVVVAKSRITKGSKIEKDDLKEVKKDISTNRRGYMPEPNLVVGKYARRDIYKNETVDPKLVEKPVLVERGVQVKIIYQTPHLYLSNKAVAMKNGRKGDMIPFRTLDGKKTVYAVVRDAKIAEIPL